MYVCPFLLQVGCKMNISFCINMIVEIYLRRQVALSCPSHLVEGGCVGYIHMVTIFVDSRLVYFVYLYMQQKDWRKKMIFFYRTYSVHSCGSDTDCYPMGGMMFTLPHTCTPPPPPLLHPHTLVHMIYKTGWKIGENG